MAVVSAFLFLTSLSIASLSFQDSALKLKEAEEAQSTLQAECEQYRAILAETVSCSPWCCVGLLLDIHCERSLGSPRLPVGSWWASHSMLGGLPRRLFASETGEVEKPEFLELFFSLIVLESFLVVVGCGTARALLSRVVESAWEPEAPRPTWGT